jgi:hypothetical protein
MRESIKQAVTTALNDENSVVIKAAAIFISAIATIEIPLGWWPNLIGILAQNAESES